jgi:glycosyltransferase involved in cell wall biosynthesis
MTPEVVVLTHFPSPYQLDLFDAVERMRPGALRVYYLHRTDAGRKWSPKAPHHGAFFLVDGIDVVSQARHDFREAPLAVFNYYADPSASALLAIRFKSGRPWAFWGERPGYQHPILGRLMRRWKLRALHGSRAPIWGIGQWAIDAYYKEFGGAHQYANLPYFSDLSAWSQAPKTRAGPRTFLFSGTLTVRKGVDLLARAFLRLAHAHPAVRLQLLGAGPLESSLTKALSPCRAQIDWLGFKDWHELGQVYASADVLCVPSRHDGWGLVVAEGLAAGLPVIGTNRTGAALDLIKPGVNGWIAEAGNEESLYHCMLQATALDEQELQGMSTAARASVHDHSVANGARRFLEAADAAWHGHVTAAEWTRPS